MYIQPHQNLEIKVPKRECQRGLEEYIVDQHQGDKQVYQGSKKPAYMYFNNPIYRFKECQNTSGILCPQTFPNSLSSRNFQNPNLDPNESALHTLYPTIDSGSVFLSEKPWDQRWKYTREDIPNETGASPEEVLISNDEMYVYDEAVNERIENDKIYNQSIRNLPIYDQNRISDEQLPDGVRKIEYPSRGGSPHLNIKNNDYILTKDDNPVVVENFTNADVSGNKGFYGYPRSNSYANMGYSNRKYDRFPRTPQSDELKKKIIENFIDINKNKGIAKEIYVLIVTLLIIFVVGSSILYISRMKKI